MATDGAEYTSAALITVEASQTPPLLVIHSATVNVWFGPSAKTHTFPEGSILREGAE
jgi:hypothetical protein